MHGIRLFLDRESAKLTGDSALLRWIIRNEGDAPVRQFDVRVKALLEDPDVRIISGSEAPGMIQPGQFCRHHTGLKVAQSSACALEIQLRGHNGTGAFFLTGQQTLLFTKPIAGSTTTIEVGNDALLKRINAAGSLHLKVGGSALIRDLDLGGQASVEIASSATTAENLIEVELSAPGLPGLHPLQLDTVAGHWPRLSKALQIEFVDTQDRPVHRALVSRHASACDNYRARIVTVQSGCLTLIAQGASGTYYLLAPNPHGLGNSPLPAGTHFFPGAPVLDVAQLPAEQRRLYFSLPAGNEHLLAALTPDPLFPQAMPLGSRLSEELVAQLLAHAYAQPGSLLALAKVATVEQ